MIMELVQKQLQQTTISKESTLRSNKNENLNLNLSSGEIAMINETVKQENMEHYNQVGPSQLWR